MILDSVCFLKEQCEGPASRRKNFCPVLLQHACVCHYRKTLSGLSGGNGSGKENKTPKSAQGFENKPLFTETSADSFNSQSPLAISNVHSIVKKQKAGTEPQPSVPSQQDGRFNFTNPCQHKKEGSKHFFFPFLFFCCPAILKKETFLLH